MKRIIAILIAVMVLIIAPVARADLWGADVGVLLQILSENIKQLVELQNIVQNAQDNLDLLREVNRGINDSLNMVHTISPYVDVGHYGDLKKIEDILKKFNEVFGAAVESPDAQSQRSVDQAVAEAVMMNNAIFDYTKDIDKIGEEIKSYSHSASPGGAAKLTAESLGVMLHVMNQQLRAQGTLLKLQAESIAASNKHEKDYTAEYLRSADSISNAMQASDPKFERPRF
jgi:hypothetical protein